MKKYQSYKPSGVDWIGDIPVHWENRKFRFLFNEKKSVSNLSLNCGSISFGKVIYKDDEGVPDERKETYQEVLKGEFLINPLNLNFDLKSLRIGLSDIDVIVSSGYIVLKLIEDNSVGFFKYLLRTFDTQHMKSLGNGVRQTISFKHLSSEELVLPPLQEQFQIVKFLDEKTELIDNLISTKERKITLLKEQRTSLINEVVTKGLNPNVKMKDSGVEWIGNIPEHWISKKLKHIFKYKKGYPFKSDDMGDEGTPIIKVTDIKNLTINKPKDYFTKGIDNRITRVKENDIIITTVGSKMEVSNSSVGQLGLVGIEQDGFLLNQNTLCIRLKGKDNNIKFVFYLLQSNRFRGHLDIHSHGTVNQSSLNVEDVLNYTIIVSDLNEQTQIVEHLDSKTKEIDDLVQLEQKKIDLLKEYRQSLISEVVTGKVKVTN